MKHQRTITYLLLSLTVSLLFVTAGCQPLQKGLDAEDDRNPYFRRASKLATEQNFHGAITEYENALRSNSEVAQAHIEMGLLYLDKLGDPISAIYHFQKYLNMRPNDSMREQLQTYIDKAKIDFAITLPNSTAQNAEEFVRMKKENVDLRQALAQTQAALAKSRDALTQAGVAQAPISIPTPAAFETSPTDTSMPSVDVSATGSSTDSSVAAPAAPRAEPVSFSNGQRSHTIAPGDSLWKIAKTYYPDNVPEGVKKIQEANPQKASDPSRLKLGVDLIIP
jgi:tetratricopeptide (TPR) repeat protein